MIKIISYIALVLSSYTLLPLSSYGDTQIIGNIKEMEKKINIEITTKKKTYSFNEEIIFDCLITNNTNQSIELFWDSPRYKFWINGVIKIDTNGFGDNHKTIQIKANSNIKKEITFSQNKSLPHLTDGDHKFNVVFFLKMSDKIMIERKIILKTEKLPPNTPNVKTIIETAKKIVQSWKSKTKIDFQEGYILDEPQDAWDVNFSNKGPEKFGTTSVMIDKKTGSTEIIKYHEFIAE